MDNNSMFKDLLETVEKMRNAQKGYFKEKDPLTKKQLLIQSKSLEGMVDNLVFNAKQLIK